MRQTIELQKLRPGDTSRMRDLNALFAHAFSEPETYLGDAPDDSYMEAWLANEHNVALVAIVAGTIVGGLVAYVLDKFEQARSEMYIYDLAVAQEYRRRGIATALIRRLQEIAGETRAWVIYVQADYGDDPAIALYQKMGAREEVLHFDIGVTG